MDRTSGDRGVTAARLEVVQALVTLWQDDRHTAIAGDVALLTDGERFPTVVSNIHTKAHPSTGGVPEDALTNRRPTTAQIRMHLATWAEAYVGASQGERRREAVRWVELLGACTDIELEQAYRPTPP